MSETTKLMAYHCAEKDNSDCAGYHDCIATQLSMPRHGELHQIDRISFYASIPSFVTTTTVGNIRHRIII